MPECPRPHTLRRSKCILPSTCLPHDSSLPHAARNRLECSLDELTRVNRPRRVEHACSMLHFTMAACQHASAAFFCCCTFATAHQDRDWQKRPARHVRPLALALTSTHAHTHTHHAVWCAPDAKRIFHSRLRTRSVHGRRRAREPDADRGVHAPLRVVHQQRRCHARVRCTVPYSDIVSVSHAAARTGRLSIRKRFRASSRHAKGTRYNFQLTHRHVSRAQQVKLTRVGKGIVISIESIGGHTLFACTVGDSDATGVSMDAWLSVEGMIKVVKRTGHSASVPPSPSHVARTD